MKILFRWYGSDDSISLDYIRQIPCIYGIVSALYKTPAGKKWPEDEIFELKKNIESHNLKFEVVESLPVHEHIKLGIKTRDQYIEIYKKNISNLAKAGIKVICYNFMPVFEWIRTTLDKEFSDGSKTLAYYTRQIKDMDPLLNDLELPGWDISYKKDELKYLILQYREMGEERLWSNLEYFLKEVMPVAEKHGIRMAIHPDDPPWPIFGLPRIITDEKNLDRFLSIIDSPSNGITFCTGSLGSSRLNNIPNMIKKYTAKRKVHFVHLRNILLLGDGSFEESGHYSSCGSLNMSAIMQIMYEEGFDGYVRSDHGRMIWGESGRPGYGLFDRALGSMYLAGIWEALDRVLKNNSIILE